jgi:hypothetical protein
MCVGSSLLDACELLLLPFKHCTYNERKKKSRLTCVRSVWVEMLSLFLLLFLFIITVYIHSRMNIQPGHLLPRSCCSSSSRHHTGTGAILFIASPLFAYISSPIYYSILRLLLDTTTTTTTTSKGKHLFRFYYPSKWPPGISPLATRKTCYYTISSDNFRLLYYVAYLYM